MIELALLSGQTGFDVSQAAPPSQLRKDHADELISARERLNPLVAVIVFDAGLELAIGNEIDQLRKDGFAVVHEGYSGLNEE